MNDTFKKSTKETLGVKKKCVNQHTMLHAIPLCSVTISIDSLTLIEYIPTIFGES